MVISCRPALLLFLHFCQCLLGIGIGMAIPLAMDGKTKTLFNCMTAFYSPNAAEQTSMEKQILCSFCRAAATPYFHQPSAAAGADPQQQRNREGQWHALKMIMAERAADCLAKLGLDPAPTPSAAEKSGVDPTSSPHLQQQQRQQAGGNVLCGGNAQNQLLFSAPHHRRSVIRPPPLPFPAFNISCLPHL
jgi:hypothetical protein